MTAAFYYRSMSCHPSSIAAAKGLANMGPVLTLFVMLGQMMTSVGLLMLAYDTQNIGLLWTTLIVAVVATQVVVAFIEDIKGQGGHSPRPGHHDPGPGHDRMPKAWIAIGDAFLLVAFPDLPGLPRGQR